jgi:hypothetical protein
MTSLSPGDEDLHGTLDRHLRRPPKELSPAEQVAWLHRAAAHENAHRARRESYHLVPAVEETTVEMWR